ncbi:MAG: hypothetical protein Q8Q01_04980 [archaeon]|nr:hypothetical protein [archaeon]
MKKILALIVITLFCLFLVGCSKDSSENVLQENQEEISPPEDIQDTPEVRRTPPRLDNSNTLTEETTSPPQTATPSGLLQPGDITYLGAFRLPEPSGGSGWGYSGYAATFYPNGDPSSNDNYPGSIFAVGHEYQQQVSEISIPEPINSKNLENLNAATTLQPFADIRGNLYGEQEIPRAGLVYYNNKLYFAWGQHFEFEITPTHGRSNVDLSNPQTEGLWSVDDFTNYVVNDYMFEIPSSWVATNTPGKPLATGRFRDGLWSGRGPALFAISTNPTNRVLDTTTLLLYGTPEQGNPEIISDESMAMNSFSETDEWSGGEWLTSGNKAALVFVGTKGVGKTWYGFANGIEYPTSGDENEIYPDVPDWPNDQRGWWSEDIQAQMIFYNPNDLAAVAKGEMNSWEPQPYATLNLNPYLIDPGFEIERGKRYSLGAPAFDRENGLFYVFERMADGPDELSVVHVFKVG